MKHYAYTLLIVAIIATGVLWLLKSVGGTKPEPEVVIPPTPQEFLKQEIAKRGLGEKDYLIMTEVVRCESGWSQFWERDYNGHIAGEVKVSNGNVGLAQINRTAHQEECNSLGLNMDDLYNNLSYATILYEREGVTPWRKWSGHCFVPALAEMGISV